MELEIEIGPAGKVFLTEPQQQWFGNHPESIQYAKFAGQDMMVIQKSDDEPDKFELHFMGLVGSDFESMDQAKACAPEFAREVFSYLGQMVKD